MESRLLFDTVFRNGAAVLELFSVEYESLFIWWDAFFVLNFGFHIIDCVRGLDLKCDRLTTEFLNENLDNICAGNILVANECNEDPNMLAQSGSGAGTAFRR